MSSGFPSTVLVADGLMVSAAFAVDGLLQFLKENKDALQLVGTAVGALTAAVWTLFKLWIDHRDKRTTRPDNLRDREAAPEAARFDVFLSHSGKDMPAVRELARTLEQREVRVWVDEDQLVPGKDVSLQLEEGIRDSHAVAVLIGKDSLGPWEDEGVQALLRLAVALRHSVIPVLLPGAPAAPVLPSFLEHRVGVDLGSGRAAEGPDRLVWGITGQRQNGDTGSGTDSGPSAEGLDRLVWGITGQRQDGDAKSGGRQAQVEGAEARAVAYWRRLFLARTPHDLRLLKHQVNGDPERSQPDIRLVRDAINEAASATATIRLFAARRRPWATIGNIAALVVSLAGVSIALLAWLLPPAATCTPGEGRACAAPSNCSGAAQTCASNGRVWSECRCPTCSERCNGIEVPDGITLFCRRKGGTCEVFVRHPYAQREEALEVAGHIRDVCGEGCSVELEPRPPN